MVAVLEVLLHDALSAGRRDVVVVIIEMDNATVMSDGQDEVCLETARENIEHEVRKHTIIERFPFPGGIEILSACERAVLKGEMLESFRDVFLIVQQFAQLGVHER